MTELYEFAKQVDVIAIFCPISWFINVDFPTLGLPISVTNPDLKSSLINFKFSLSCVS